MEDNLVAQLQAAQFQPAEFARQVYQAVPSHGTTIDDMLKPEYWAHIATKLRPTYRIEVNAEDGSFFAELIVRDAGRTWAKVALLRHKTFDDGADILGESPAPDYVINFRVGPTKWRVQRKSDGEVLRSGFISKPEAEAWAKTHTQAMAA
jgi:hypothetical protein